MARNYNTFDITCTYMGEEFEVTIDGSTCSKSDVLENLKEQKTEGQDEEIDENAEELSDDFEVTDWQDVPEWAQDFDILEDLMPEFESSSYDIEVFEAAKECDVQFSDIDEAYNGEHDSDEAFARDMAEQLGSISKDVSWPYTCIDWEQAARELMYDYSEANGHYFRNL